MAEVLLLLLDSVLNYFLGDNINSISDRKPNTPERMGAKLTMSPVDCNRKKQTKETGFWCLEFLTLKQNEYRDCMLKFANYVNYHLPF